MGINIPIEEIEQFQDDYLWDDVKDHIKLIRWESGLISWTDISDSENSDSDSEEEEEYQDINQDEEQIIINEILDRYEERQEVIDFSQLIDLL